MRQEAGIEVRPEIMVPQVITSAGTGALMSTLSEDDGSAQEGVWCERLDFKFGTMIETVRACTRATEACRERRVLLVRYQ